MRLVFDRFRVPSRTRCGSAVSTGARIVIVKVYDKRKKKKMGKGREWQGAKGERRGEQLINKGMSGENVEMGKTWKTA